MCAGGAGYAARRSNIPDQYRHPGGRSSTHNLRTGEVCVNALRHLIPGLAACEALYHAVV